MSRSEIPENYIDAPNTIIAGRIYTTFQIVAPTVAKCFKTLYPIETMEGRVGGYFAYTNHNGIPLMQCLVNSVAPENVNRYRHYSLEKPTRLAQHCDHLTSAQSADDAKEQYPGAIRIRTGLFSFSGYNPGLIDELVCIYVVRGVYESAPWVENDIQEILAANPNPYYDQYADYLSRGGVV